MKNINYVINGVLAVAVIILFVLQFSGKKENQTPKVAQSGELTAEGMLPIAFVNVDSLLLNYNYAKDLLEIQIKKQENARAMIGQQSREFEKDYQDFVRKAENNAFLTNERAEQEQQRLLRKRQELEDLSNRTTDDLMAEQQQMNIQLRDSVVSQLHIFNQSKGYQVIFSNTGGDNILIANDMYDITEEFIEFLNKGYYGKQ